MAIKLSEFRNTAAIYTHPVGNGSEHLPAGGSVGQVVVNTNPGNGSWEDPSTVPLNNTNTVPSDVLVEVNDDGVMRKQTLSTFKDNFYSLSGGTPYDQHSATGGRVLMPDGASYHTGSSSVTGAIKITLPTISTNDMLSFEVRVYDYAGNESFTAYIYGYHFAGPGWGNCSACIISSDKQSTKKFVVRFGHDGTKACVWIGETNSTWRYPQIGVFNFVVGFSSPDVYAYTTGWNISFATSFENVNATILNTLPIARRDDPTVVTLYNNSTGLGAGDISLSDSVWDYDELLVIHSNDSKSYFSIYRQLVSDIQALHNYTTQKYSLTNGHYYWGGRFNAAGTFFDTLSENSVIYRLQGVKW